MRHAHFFGKLAGHHDLIRRIDVFLGREVIHHQKNAILVEHLGRTHCPEGLDGERRGDVVGEDAGKLAVDDLSGFADFFVRVGLKNFLRECKRHGGSQKVKNSLNFS